MNFNFQLIRYQFFVVSDFRPETVREVLQLILGNAKVKHLVGDERPAATGDGFEVYQGVSLRDAATIHTSIQILLPKATVAFALQEIETESEYLRGCKTADKIRP